MTETAMIIPTDSTPAAHDEAALARMAGMVNPADAPMQTGPDVLKINYEEDLSFPRGVWVLGQKKDKDENVTEEGKQVSKVLILTVRYRYSYYDEKTKTAFNTQIFESGSQPRDKAEFDRKVAEAGGKGQFQSVVLGLAFVDGGMKDFVAYIKGSAWKPFSDYMKELIVYVKPDGSTMSPVPPFIYVTELLETTKHKNGSITYWVPNFKKGVEVPVAQFDMLEKKREEAYSFVEYSNSRAEERSAAAPAAAPPSSAPPAYTPPKAETPAYTPPPATTLDGDLPWDTPAAAAPPKAAPATEPAPAVADPASDDFDIEAAMKNIMGD